MKVRLVPPGWHFTRFGAWEIEQATGERWGFNLSFDPRGFELLLFRWQIDYLRKPFRLEDDR